MPPSARVWIVQENSLLVAVMARIARRVADCRQIAGEALPADTGEVEVVIVGDRQLGEQSRQRLAGGRRLLLATVDDDEQARSALDRGAEGVVDSEALAEDLPLALAALFAGRTYVSPAIAARMGCCPLVREHGPGGSQTGLRLPRSPAADAESREAAVLRVLGSDRAPAADVVKPL